MLSVECAALRVGHLVYADSGPEKVGSIRDVSVEKN